jgi:outer membrane protein TolC
MTTHPAIRAPAAGLLLTAALALSGCASLSPDRGMIVVAAATEQTIGKDVAFVRSADDFEVVRGTVRRLLSRPLNVDAAVQIALLSNKRIQASYNELALAETDLVEQSLPPNPTFAISRISGNGASEVERQVVGDILALATLPFRSDIARERFRQAQLRAALETLRLAAEVRRAYFRAVAANEMVVLLTDAKSTAESTAQLAKKLGETGSLNKLDQAREQVFYAETTADLASARQEAANARERLCAIDGIVGRRSFLPATAQAAAAATASQGFAFDRSRRRRASHRPSDRAHGACVAGKGARSLTEATRFVTLLDLAGVAKRTQDPEGPPFRERGFEITFQIPVFDGGEVRVRQAAETYNLGFNRLTERAINVRSEARDAYQIYRSAYDIAVHYQREILPLRQIITEEMQLRFSSMQIDVFALLTEARQRLASLRAAIDAKRAFFLAQSDLQTAVNGGGSGAREAPTTTAAAGPPAAGPH